MILNGWKEIAHYTGRGVRTVQRWESIGLPVRRPAGRLRSAVFTTSEEIDEWVRSCKDRHSTTEALPSLADLKLAVDLIRRLRVQHERLLQRITESKLVVGSAKGSPASLASRSSA